MSPVIKGMITLAKGAILARIVGFASIPILTRIYGPEDYGILALYTSIIAILAPVLTLRYVTAIPLPKTDAMAMNLFSLCLKLISIGSILIAIVLWLFGTTILSWFNMEALAPWWPLIVLGTTGTATYELFSLWATRKKQYKTIAKTQFTQSLLGNITKIGLGLIALKPGGLLLGQFIAQTGGIGSFLKESIRDFRLLKNRVTTKRIKLIAKYHIDFPIYRLPSQFLMIISVQAPILMMAALYNKDVTGQLSLAMTALSLPAGLIGSAVSKAYYAEIAALGRNNLDQIRKITTDTQKKLFLVGVPITISAMLLAEPAFKIVFGDRWAEAGRFAAILSPFILLQFTSSPLVQVINVIGSQLNYLFINLFRILGLGIILFIFKTFNYQVNTFVQAISIFLFIFYILISSYIFLIISKK